MYNHKHNNELDGTAKGEVGEGDGGGSTMRVNWS